MSGKLKHTAWWRVPGVVAGFALFLAILPGLVPADSSDGDALFWRIDREGDVAGYLLGTVHSEDPRVLEYREEFLDMLTACDTFAMEMVPDLPTMRRLMDAMRQPAGADLREQLGAERFDRVVEALSGYGVTGPNARQLKPWAVMMILSMPPPKSGLFMDFSLSLRASGAGLDVVGLETLQEQLSFLDDLELPAQIEMLDQAVAEVDRVDETHTRLVDIYLVGSLDRLQAESDAEMSVLSPKTREYFQAEGIDRRNARMLKNALPLLDEGCAFIAVGALHLPGEAGLVNGFQSEGFGLVPMPSPFPAAVSEVRP